METETISSVWKKAIHWAIFSVISTFIVIVGEHQLALIHYLNMLFLLILIHILFAGLFMFTKCQYRILTIVMKIVGFGAMFLLLFLTSFGLKVLGLVSSETEITDDILVNIFASSIGISISIPMLLLFISRKRFFQLN